MSNVKFITRAGVQQLIDSRTSDNAIIFLSGPTSRGTPLSLLQNNDVITVNGAAEYLLSNSITPFIYVLTDARFCYKDVMIFINSVGRANSLSSIWMFMKPLRTMIRNICAIIVLFCVHFISEKKAVCSRS